MLIRGNSKLGAADVWGFGLPSGDPGVCVGMTAICARHCYAWRIEKFRPSVLAAYTRNLAATKDDDFVDRVVGFAIARRVKVVRIHTAGEFYAAAYVRKWQAVAARLPQTMFYAYTRAWRSPALRPALDRLGGSTNCRLWYSVDRDSGFPKRIPPAVRLAWLMTTPDDRPPRPVDLVFRIASLRRVVMKSVSGALVCPVENGVTLKAPMTCEACKYCWGDASLRRKRAPAGESIPPGTAAKRVTLTLV